MKVRELVIGAAVGASAAYVAASRGKVSGHALADVQGALRELEDGQAGDRDSLARQVESLQRGQEEMLEFVRSVLDDEALSGGNGTAHRRRVVSVSVRAGAAEDVMRGLVGSFCDGIGMEVILQAEKGASAGAGRTWCGGRRTGGRLRTCWPPCSRRCRGTAAVSTRRISLAWMSCGGCCWPCTSAARAPSGSGR